MAIYVLLSHHPPLNVTSLRPLRPVASFDWLALDVWLFNDIAGFHGSGIVVASMQEICLTTGTEDQRGGPPLIPARGHHYQDAYLEIPLLPLPPPPQHISSLYRLAAS